MVNELNQQIYTQKEIKEMKEKGLYTSSDEKSFKSDKQIKRKLALKGELPVFETQIPDKKDFEYWNNRMVTRKEQYAETIPHKENDVTISFKEDIIVNFIGDIHAGSPTTEYKRVAQELEVIVNTPESYVILGGDLIDGFFFRPAQYEQIEQTPEQLAYMHSLIEFLAEHKRILVGYGGDHDQDWSMKSGTNPYYDFAEKTGAYYMHGIGFITLNVGEQPYKLCGAHRLAGHSMYNNVHPEMRLGKTVQGSDIYFGLHTHQKGHAQQATKMFGNEDKLVTYISVGPYKSEDGYSRKMGWARQTPSEMYGSAIKLSSERFSVEYFEDILVANS